MDQQQQAMRTAIQTSVEEALETNSGSDEYTWENGEARIYHEEEQDDHPDLEFVYP